MDTYKHSPTHLHRHTNTQSWGLRRVVTQAAAFVLKHRVCAVNVQQLVGIDGHQDAADVGLCGRKTKDKQRTRRRVDDCMQLTFDDIKLLN